MQLTLHCDHCNHTMLIQKPSFEEDLHCESCKEYIKTFSAYIEKNTIVNEQFQIKYPVCEDNCSQTFIAFDINSEQLCIIRIYDPELSHCVSDTNNFMDVLKSAASIAGKSHIRVVDQGIDDEHIFQVYNYAEIESLGDIVDENRELDPTEALDLCRELLLSLDEASIATGTGHFNLTPSNVFVDSQGNLRYTDFGLASQLIRDNKFLQSNYHVLNIHYMSPEMALAWNTPNAASDIYSIGCLIFFALTNMDPFAGIDSPENIDYDKLLLPRRIELDLDHQYIDIFQKMTATNPLQRYQSYREALDAIERYRNSIHTTTKIGKARGHRTQIYDSVEFHNLETTHHLKRTSNHSGQYASVNHDEIRAQMSSKPNAPLPKDFAKKMSSRSTGKGPRAKRSGKNTAKHTRVSRRGNSSSSPTGRRGSASSSPSGRRGQISGSPGARRQGSAAQHKRPLPPRPVKKGSTNSSGGNGMLVGTLVVTLILVVIGAVFLLNQQKKEIQVAEQHKQAAATNKTVVEKPKAEVITTPLPPEYAEHIHWLKAALQKGEFEATEFTERLDKVRIMAHGRPRSMAMVDSIEQEMKADQDEKKRLIIVALKSAVQDLVYQEKFDEAIALCEDETAPNATETSSIRKELLTKVQEQQKSKADAQKVAQLDARNLIISQLTQSICRANEISTKNLLEDLAEQVPSEQITSQEMLTLTQLCSPENRASLIGENLTKMIGSEISIFHDDQNYSGSITAVNNETQSFKLKFIFNNKTMEREFPIQQLPPQLRSDLLKTDSTSDSAFIRFWHATEEQDFAQASLAIQAYDGHYKTELSEAIALSINERATEELSEISEIFKLKDLSADQPNISQANAIVAQHLLNKCLRDYQDTAIIMSQKEKIDGILSVLQTKVPDTKKMTFVSPKTTSSSISLNEALLKPKTLELILLPGSYTGSYQLNKPGLKISGCNGVDFSSDIHILANEIKLKNIHLSNGEIFISKDTSKVSIENCHFETKGINLSANNSDILINNCILHGLKVHDCKRLKVLNSTLLESAGIGNASSKFCIHGPFNGDISNSIIFAQEGHALNFKQEVKSNFNIAYSLVFAQRGHIHYNDKKISLSDPKEVAKALGRWSHSIIEQPQFISYGSDYRLKDFTPGFATGDNKLNMGVQLSSDQSFIDIRP